MKEKIITLVLCLSFIVIAALLFCKAQSLASLPDNNGILIDRNEEAKASHYDFGSYIEVRFDDGQTFVWSRP